MLRLGLPGPDEAEARGPGGRVPAEHGRGAAGDLRRRARGGGDGDMGEGDVREQVRRRHWGRELRIRDALGFWARRGGRRGVARVLGGGARRRGVEELAVCTRGWSMRLPFSNKYFYLIRERRQPRRQSHGDAVSSNEAFLPLTGRWDPPLRYR